MIRLSVVLGWLTAFVFSSSAQSLLLPVKNYVIYNSASNTLTAYFGYNNTGTNARTVSLGSNNIFDPPPAVRNQPTTFLAGYHPDVFSITFPADSYLTWTLLGFSVRASISDIAYINYQGRLSSGGQPVNAVMDFRFKVFDGTTNQLYPTLTYDTTNAIAVSNGLFNVVLQLNQQLFTNAACMLEIQTCPTGTGSYVTLAPRQRLTAAPIAANAMCLGGAESSAFVRLDNTNAFIAPFKLGPVIARPSSGGYMEIERGGVNEPSLRLSSTSPGHGSGVWLENRSGGATNTWSVYCSSSGVFTIGKQETQQTGLSINPSTMNVTVVSLTQSSDRNAKENFARINPTEILEKVARLDISRWNFKGDTNTPHIGPMAQDFYAAFGTGTDEKHIATVDADGVALAAIQGLNAEVEKLRRDNKTLEERLQKLEALLEKNGR